MLQRVMIGVLMLISISTHAIAADCADAPKVEEIAEGVYVRQGQHGIAFQDENFANIGFVVGQNCVAVIDSGGSPNGGFNKPVGR